MKKHTLTKYLALTCAVSLLVTLTACGTADALSGTETLAQPGIQIDAVPLSNVSQETADARLQRVTQIVKTRLDLDTDVYDDFHGEVMEQPQGNVWNLYWSGTDMSLNVDALENGTVTGYWYNDNQNDYYYSNSLPSFPKIDAARAKNAANAFLAKVLDTSTESVELDEPASAKQLGESNAWFAGTILLNGLPSPLSYNITVRGSDYTVTNFHRDAPESSFIGNIPSAQPAVSSSDAAKTLRTVQNLALIYVRSETDTNRAVLRYVPKDIETQYVDAQTGKLVKPGDNIFAYNTSMRNMAGPEAMEMSADDAGGTALKELSQTELEGVRKLEGVLSTDELDRIIRAESAYQLDGYTIRSSGYRLVQDNSSRPSVPTPSPTGNRAVEKNTAADNAERVLCTLRYRLENADGTSSDRNFTVDARTGRVESLYGYSYTSREKDTKPDVTAADAQKTAESFLSRYTSNANAMPLYDSTDNTADGEAYYAFTFARKVNDYFFPENSCTIQIDCMTGAVCGLSQIWDDDITFDAVSGLISADKALDAWMNAHETVLAYRYLSKELDPAVPTEARMIDMGMTRFYTLLLSYALEREISCPGIDAKTAQPVEFEPSDNTISYSDIANHAAKTEIERLAEFNIGYSGGKFEPAKTLTQWDVIQLLASVRNWRPDDPENITDAEKNNAYRTAYQMGVLKREERQDNAAVSRGGLVKLLLNAAGYRNTASLPGIFTCNYPDHDSISTADMGYAALAQALGILPQTEVYNAAGTATRADAAVWLCRLMSYSA